MNAKRIVIDAEMTLKHRAEQVFPLLCPVREYEWIETWECTLIHSSSGLAELGCIFTTRFAQDGPEDTWVVSRYEAPRVIEFVRVNPWRVVHFTIHCTAGDEQSSQWQWSQTITAASDAGQALIERSSTADFAEKISALGTMLDHYLTTGTMLRAQATEA